MTLEKPIRFILNDAEVSTKLPVGMVTLDFLRLHQRLTGTKEGCREGDCGACLVLLGELDVDAMRYHPVNSCLLPVGELAGKHLMTIEGLNQKDLNVIQQAIVDEGATQCGYCTPGIVVALTGFLLNAQTLEEKEAIAALDGNLCRCTGYQSIKRAARLVCRKLSEQLLPLENDCDRRLRRLVELKILPSYLLSIPDRLRQLRPAPGDSPSASSRPPVIVAGGTDLFVQRPEEMREANLDLLSARQDLKGIRIDGNRCHIGAATSVEEMKNSPLLQELFPRLGDYFKLISSTPIRNRATVGGNIVNASPIGDLTIFFLALDATITLLDGHQRRELPLRSFFQGYKLLDKAENELLAEISFPLLKKSFVFNFEKVCKRLHLDIASVNSAMQLQLENGRIRRAHLSAGGVAPIPLYLSRTAEFLVGKEINLHTATEAAAIAQTEISPISDVRGSARYKRLLLRQLIISHFSACFPQQMNEEVRR